MTHLTCPKCQSNDHTTGYGLAAGPMGAYVFCNKCDTLIDFTPDLDGMEGTEAYKHILENLNIHMKPIWGDKWDEATHKLKAEAYNAAPPSATTHCDCASKQVPRAECTYPNCATFFNSATVVHHAPETIVHITPAIDEKCEHIWPEDPPQDSSCCTKCGVSFLRYVHSIF